MLLGSLPLIVVLWPLLATLLNTSGGQLLAVLHDDEVLRSLGVTFYAATLATLIALVTGVPLAYLLARYDFRGRAWLAAIVDLPVVIPHTAAGIALLGVVGRRAPLGRAAAAFGVAFTGSVPGITAAMLFVSLPFLINGARETFALIDPELEMVALVEGASRWQAFRYVTLPLAWRGILAGALMMWARALSEFGAVVILAYHPKIVPVLVYERFAGFGLDAARPIAVLLILAALTVFVVLRTVLRRSQG